MTLDALAIQARLRLSCHARGGRPTDSECPVRRQIGLSQVTLDRLKAISAQLGAKGVIAGPMQVAAFLLEKGIQQADDTNRSIDTERAQPVTIDTGRNATTTPNGSGEP